MVQFFSVVCEVVVFGFVPSVQRPISKGHSGSNSSMQRCIAICKSLVFGEESLLTSMLISQASRLFE